MSRVKVVQRGATRSFGGSDCGRMRTVRICGQRKVQGEVGMSATVYKWIIVYEGGYTEEKLGTCPAAFADDLVAVPIAIIREG